MNREVITCITRERNIKVTISVFIIKVWPMGVASTVSRLPVTVKVVPVSSNEEEGGREQQQQQQGEHEEEGPQQQTSQTQAEEEVAQSGNVCEIMHHVNHIDRIMTTRSLKALNIIPAVVSAPQLFSMVTQIAFDDDE